MLTRADVAFVTLILLSLVMSVGGVALGSLALQKRLDSDALAADGSDPLSGPLLTANVIPEANNTYDVTGFTTLYTTLLNDLPTSQLLTTADFSAGKFVSFASAHQLQSVPGLTLDQLTAFATGGPYMGSSTSNVMRGAIDMQSNTLFASRLNSFVIDDIVQSAGSVTAQNAAAFATTTDIEDSALKSSLIVTCATSPTAQHIAMFNTATSISDSFVPLASVATCASPGGAGDMVVFDAAIGAVKPSDAAVSEVAIGSDFIRTTQETTLAATLSATTIAETAPIALVAFSTASTPITELGIMQFVPLESPTTVYAGQMTLNMNSFQYTGTTAVTARIAYYFSIAGGDSNVEFWVNTGFSESTAQKRAMTIGVDSNFVPTLCELVTEMQPQQSFALALTTSAGAVVVRAVTLDVTVL